MEAVRGGKQSLQDASQRLGLSYRQVRRIWQRYEEKKEAGLVHRGRGRRSNRSKPEATRESCLSIYREDLEGFGPTLAAEKLAERKLFVDHETLRRWLLKAGLWQKERQRGKYRRQRPRKEHFGELVQMDGSHHDWFGSGKRCCVLSLVDDATSRRHSRMSEEETTDAAMELLWNWVRRYGAPRALYCDRKNVYVTDREPTMEEDLAGEPALTAFGKVCRKLGIEIIAAHSPQAKGRVERSHGVYQDRWVKELRLRKITTLEAANELLDAGGFDAELNRRFGKSPASPLDLHQPISKRLDLGGVFAYEQTRVVQNDWTVRFENRWFQIGGSRRQRPAAKSKIVIQQRLDGSLRLLYRDQPLAYEELSQRPSPPVPKGSTTSAEPESPRPTPRPAQDHPWRATFSRRQLRRAAERAASAENPQTGLPQPLGKRSAFPTRPAAPTTG